MVEGVAATPCSLTYFAAGNNGLTNYRGEKKGAQSAVRPALKCTPDFYRKNCENFTSMPHLYG